ncbi:FecR domain-containing protein [Pedobacter sp. ASV1-7]|uniref:FecR family protein n=1 Tax=Pedobacter sp. ASV1-7 TaxID=3145237 RepID=UPI0032E8FCAE
MISDEEYIEQLFLEEIVGSIDEAGKADLHFLINKNDENRAIYQDLQKIHGVDVRKFTSSINHEHDIEKVYKKIKQQKKASFKLRSILVPTIAAVLLVFLTLFIFKKEKRNDFATNTPVELKDTLEGVKLVSNSGEEIGLTQTENTVELNGVTLSTNKNGIQSIQSKDIVYNTIVVPATYDYKVRLPDGSLVYLNSMSSLKFPTRFEGSTREIYTEGEAYLEVTKNSKPFIVHSGGVTIKVLGTKFNVNAYKNNEITTSLLEGSVEVSSKTDTVKLTPGFESKYVRNLGFKTNHFHDNNIISWVRGEYYFRNASINELAQVMRRWFDMELVFDYDKFKDFKVTGLLEKSNLPDFLENIQAASDVKLSKEGRKIRFQ